MKTPEKRKEESIEYLKAMNISINEWLPVIETGAETILRSKEEIVKRAIAICICCLYAEGLHDGSTIEENKEFINEIIDLFNAKSFFSPKEKEFLDNIKPSDQDTINFVWQYEGYTVLLWALGYIEILPFPKEICDVPGVVRILKKNDSYDKFLNNADLRSKEEILDYADLIYRIHWATVYARINNQKIEGVDPGVVYERHYAINWLINYMSQEWDDISTDT